MPRVADLTVGIGADSAELQQGFDKATRDTKNFADKTGKQLEVVSRKTARETKKTQRQIERFRRGVIRDFKSLATSARNLGAAFVAGFGALAVTQAQYAREVSQTAKATGLTAKEVQVLSTALESLGKDGEGVNDIVIDLRDRIQELRDGTSSFTEDFALLGLELSDFDGKSAIEQIQTLSDAVANAADPERAQAGIARILPQFQEIAGQLGPAFNDFNKQLAETGGLIDGNVDGFQAFSNTMTVAAQTLRAQFINGLQDAVGGAENLNGAIKTLGEVVRSGTEAIVATAKFLFEYRTIILSVTAAIAGFVVVAKTISSAIVVINAAKIAFAALSGVVAPIVAGITKLLPVVTKLAVAFAPLALKIGLVVGAAIGLAAIARVIQSQWEHVVSFFSNGTKVITSRFNQLGYNIAFVFRTVWKGIQDGINFVLKFVQNGINNLIDAYNSLPSFLRGEDISRIDITFDTTGAQEEIDALRAKAIEYGQEAENYIQAANESARNILEGGIETLTEDYNNLKELVFGKTEELAAAPPVSDEQTDKAVEGNKRTVKSLEEVIAANDKTAINAIALSTATDTLRMRYGELSGTQSEVNQQLIDRIRLEEDLAEANAAVVRAYNNITLAGQEFADATAGYSADDRQQVQDFLNARVQAGLVPPEQLEQATEQTSFALVESLRSSLSSAVQTGDFSQVGEAMFNNLRNTLSQGFVDRFADYLNQALSQLLSGEGFGGFGLGNLFGGSFQQGGIVPGNRGDAVLIRAHAGERVLPVGQTGATINFQNTVTGDLSRSTRRELIQLNREQQAAGFMAARANGGA